MDLSDSLLNCYNLFELVLQLSNSASDLFLQNNEQRRLRESAPISRSLDRSFNVKMMTKTISKGRC